MASDRIRTSLSPAGGLGVQTTKLADNIQSLRKASSMLQSTTAQVQKAPAAVRSKLEPVLAQTVTPLLKIGTHVAEDLVRVADRMKPYLAGIEALPGKAHGLEKKFLRPIVASALCHLLVDAKAVQASAQHASASLTTYRDAANKASATLNSYSEAIEQEDKALMRRAREIVQKMHAMTSGNCCEQIGHAFQMAFGHLKDELEKGQKQIRRLEYIAALDQNAIMGLERLTSELGGISSVSSALEVSWRSVADGLGALHDDLDQVLKDASVDDVNADLEYVQADWKSIQATLDKIV